MKNNVITKASQTNVGTYVVQTKGNEENNYAFNYEWNEDAPTESVAGVTIIIQNYAEMALTLGRTIHSMALRNIRTTSVTSLILSPDFDSTRR